MNKYTFLIDLGGEAFTRTFSGHSRKDALELTELSLSDEQKRRVKNITVLAVTYPEQQNTDS